MLHELFHIYVKLKPTSTTWVMGKCGIALGLCFALFFVDHLVPIKLLTKSHAANIVSSVLSLTTLVTMAVTLADTYLVTRILLALKENQDFKRQLRSQKNGSLSFFSWASSCL